MSGKKRASGGFSFLDRMFRERMGTLKYVNYVTRIFRERLLPGGEKFGFEWKEDLLLVNLDGKKILEVSLLDIEELRSAAPNAFEKKLLEGVLRKKIFCRREGAYHDFVIGEGEVSGDGTDAGKD